MALCHSHVRDQPTEFYSINCNDLREAPRDWFDQSRTPTSSQWCTLCYRGYNALPGIFGQPLTLIVAFYDYDI